MVSKQLCWSENVINLENVKAKLVFIFFKSFPSSELKNLFCQNIKNFLLLQFLLFFFTIFLYSGSSCPYFLLLLFLNKNFHSSCYHFQSMMRKKEFIFLCKSYKVNKRIWNWASGRKSEWFFCYFVVQHVSQKLSSIIDIKQIIKTYFPCQSSGKMWKLLP